MNQNSHQKSHESFHVLDVSWEDHMNCKFSLKKIKNKDTTAQEHILDISLKVLVKDILQGMKIFN